MSEQSDLVYKYSSLIALLIIGETRQYLHKYKFTLYKSLKSL